MINKSPIFINAFSRGGSNIIWETLQSHPEACGTGECDKLIRRENKKSTAIEKFLLDAKLSIKSGDPLPHPFKKDGSWFLNHGVFNASNFSERNLNDFGRKFFDEGLHRWKMNNLNNPFNKFKTETVEYTKEELTQTRLVGKHINGTVLFVPNLIEMYPDSIHIGLMRNGLALLESRTRRNTFKSEMKFGAVYNKMAETFMKYEEQYDNFHILKFEDFLEEPQAFLERLHHLVGLSYDKDRKIRLKAKKYIKPSGEHSTAFKENSKYWIEQKELLSFVNPKINQFQIDRLSEGQKNAFLSVAKESMEKFGYL